MEPMVRMEQTDQLVQQEILEQQVHKEFKV
jgi:hypothetical protein